jgi:hypothetical protein
MLLILWLFERDDIFNRHNFALSKIAWILDHHLK